MVYRVADGLKCRIFGRSVKTTRCERPDATQAGNRRHPPRFDRRARAGLMRSVADRLVAQRDAHEEEQQDEPAQAEHDLEAAADDGRKVQHAAERPAGRP